MLSYIIFNFGSSESLLNGQVAVRLVALLAPDYTTSLRLTCAPLMAGQALSGSLRHVGRRRAPPQPSPAEPGWQEDWLPGRGERPQAERSC